jgi:hypothetical protein
VTKTGEINDEVTTAGMLMNNLSLTDFGLEVEGKGTTELNNGEVVGTAKPG